MRQQKRRVLGSAVLGIAAALAVGGCSAGQITQTDAMEAAVNGAQATAGSIAIRNATVVYPPERNAYQPGSNAELNVRIINDGEAPDELVSVSSPAAANATVTGPTTVAPRNALVVGPPGGKLEHEEPFQRPTEGPEVIERASVTLQQFTRELRPGQTIKVTFTFAGAGPVTVDMPVGAPEHPRTEHPGIEAEGEGGH